MRGVPILRVALSARLGCPLVSTSRLASADASTSTSAVPAESSEADEGASGDSRRLKVISRALETYLNEVRSHNKMMDRERAEFERGKRHLANIMGLDPNSVTQPDIDKAIEYLFPSGLTDPRALPVMKPPEEILPQIRKLTFTDEGRPVDPLFYTLKPKFYRLLSDIGLKTSRLVTYQHQQILLNQEDRVEQSELSLVGSKWISKEALNKKLDERFDDTMYAQLIMALDYLVSLPFANMERDFIGEFREALTNETGSGIFGPPIPEVEIVPETQRRQARTQTRLKRSKCEIVVTDAGTGKYTVNGFTLDDFQSLQAREILLAPLILASDLVGKLDIEAKVEGPGGHSVVPRIVRHALSLCIAALFPEHAAKFRLAGLLTSDPRRKERMKINQPGARSKWRWKKR